MSEYGGIQCQTPDLRASTLYAALTDADRLENRKALARHHTHRRSRTLDLRNRPTNHHPANRTQDLAAAR
ncbi:hypothetical protein FOS14_18910 [Skermania sp. ID1734]|uniref:hypothetical protein n=1 Tax=Skermania sp. ID1734 TaxID=2597516 RepID=UPI0011814687|nr:hypothetical protein [Skermania sp. ID1734]TSD95063.1 hypothetical protein FOS14_18910 [Skermania sp. ID1734]